ncbi:MAG: sensor histidine kinase [Verrucomicrobiales bacterium]
MRRPIITWVIFFCCAALLLGALGWVTVHTLRLESEKQTATRDAEIQERVRLALWRLESAAMSILIRENARPPEHFRAFHEAPETFNKAYEPLPAGEVLVPSPLLTERPDDVLLFFQREADGRWTSPQVPDGTQRQLAERLYTTRENIEQAALRLQEAEPWLKNTAPLSVRTQQTAAISAKSPAFQNPTPVQAAWRNNDQTQQASNNLNELTRRTQNVQAQISQGNVSKLAPEKKAGTSTVDDKPRKDPFAGIAIDALNAAEANRQNRGPPDQAEAFRAVWQNGSLVLLRPAMLKGRPVTQGVWLDWSSLRDGWLRDIADLLPAAALFSVSASGSPIDPLRLVSLPVRLQGGVVPLPELPFWSPLRRTLGLAWAGALMAAVAVGLLLHGALSLSERRAAFVSAVTHELRTPLSTFRLYAEMLKEGMVPDAATRHQYLETLDTEAGRLQHLVENVLAYARLERGSGRGRVETMSLGELITKVRPRLEQRVAQAEAELVETVPPNTAANVRVNVDVAAVEQILFNLVDNACKYGVPGASERRVDLEAEAKGRRVLLRIRDHGGGLESSDLRKLFRPFHKSAREAAHSAPGVGLGLALSRRLARALGGDLRVDIRITNGACFVLEVPRA